MRRVRSRAGVAAIAGLLTVIIGGIVLLGGEDASAPPADLATRLVPADTLVYLHLSTDMERPGTKEAEAIARRFPGYERARADLVKRLTAPSCGVRASDLRGEEAALALIDPGGGTAGSLVLLDTGEEASGPQEDKLCGTIQTARIGRFLVVGQPQTLQIAKNLARGKGRSLAQAPRYRAATASLPDDRVLDGWVSQAGVRRLLAPQGGVLGAAGTLLDQPRLEGAAVALTAGEKVARLTVRTALGKASGGTTETFRTFTPRRQADAPKGALAYLGVSGLTTGLQRVLAVTGSGSGGLAGLGPLLERARTQIGKEAGAGVVKELLAVFGGETGLWLTPGLPAPTLTVTAGTDDEDAAAKALRALERPVARLLAPDGGSAPSWSRKDGIASLRLTAGVELHYAVADGRVVLATKRQGVEQVLRDSGGLVDSEPWRAVLENPGKPTTSLVFLDLSQLLRLAEQTGLRDNRSYLAVQDDLNTVRSIGARSTGNADETTAEILFSIP